MRSPQSLARIAGVLYLLVGVTGGFAEGYVPAQVYVPGDAAATAHNVVARSGLVRAAVVADLLQVVLFTLTGMALYLLLQHVHRNVARAMMVFVAISVAMMGLNRVHEFAALQVATDPAYAGAFGPGGSEAMVLLLFDLQHYGVLAAQIFFALWLVPLGYLVHASGMFPRFLGILLPLGCAGYLINVFSQFLDPDLSAALAPFVLAPPTLAEVAMVVWLLVKGVRIPRPHDLPLATT